MTGVEAAFAAVASGVLAPVPLLILHGEEDVLCNIAGSRKLLAALGGEGAKDKTLLPFPGLKHEILTEGGPRGAPEVLRALQAWLEAHL